MDGLQTVPSSMFDSEPSTMSSSYVPDFDVFLRDSEVPSPTNFYAGSTTPSFFTDSDFALLTSMEDSFVPLNNFVSSDPPTVPFISVVADSSKLCELKTATETSKTGGGNSVSDAAVAMLESFASAVCDVTIKKEPLETFSETSCPATFTNGEQLPVVTNIKTESTAAALNVNTNDTFETVEYVMEQLVKDIDVACSNLAISRDPVNWSSEDVRKWLLWTLRQYSLPMIQLEYFDLDGATLCSLSDHDFRQRTSLQCGDTLYAQLDIWKIAANFHREQRQPPAPTPSPQPVQQVFQPDDSLLDISNYINWNVRSTPSPVPVREGSVSPAHSLITNLTVPSSDYSSDSGFQSDDDTSEDGLETEKTTVARQGSHSHIHLWQFLKELLLHPQMYGSCIRWLDRNKGVFKIEDSVRVARLWGKRKNRPAMNYDKLSRSIRQYYKKGIMKKTERSQRLVYQFCHPYCL